MEGNQFLSKKKKAKHIYSIKHAEFKKNFKKFKEKIKKNQTKSKHPQKRKFNNNKIENNLDDSKFRILNEKLYKSSSQEALDYFQNNKDDFLTYHNGFKLQSEKWPVNPNNVIIKLLLNEKYKNSIICDIGCGEAKIAQKLIPLGYNILSFDLVSLNKYVKIANMSNLPLDKEICDICIFCLSLMNKNFIPFIIESNRVLKKNGKLLVAEITSRIVNKNSFVNIFEKYEYKLIKEKNIQDYFCFFSFSKVKYVEIKIEDEKREDTYDILKPCIYKKR